MDDTPKPETTIDKKSFRVGMVVGVIFAILFHALMSFVINHISGPITVALIFPDVGVPSGWQMEAAKAFGLLLTWAIVAPIGWWVLNKIL